MFGRRPPARGFAGLSVVLPSWPAMSAVRGTLLLVSPGFIATNSRPNFVDLRSGMDDHPFRGDPSMPALQEPITNSSEMTALLSALTALKKGQSDVRLPLDWTGVAGKVADAFNAV